MGGTELCSNFIVIMISLFLMTTVFEFALTVFFCCKPILDSLKSSVSLTGCLANSKQRDLPVVLQNL